MPEKPEKRYECYILLYKVIEIYIDRNKEGHVEWELSWKCTKCDCNLSSYK